MPNIKNTNFSNWGKDLNKDMQMICCKSNTKNENNTMLSKDM